MDQSAPDRVLKDFRERVAQGNLAGITVIQRITGGMPAEGVVQQEFAVSGLNKATARTRTRAATLADASDQLDPTEVLDLFTKVSAGITGLVPRSEARFAPDSVVGSITVDVDGERATFYYPVDQDEQELRANPIPQKMSDTLALLSTLSKQLLRK